MDGPTSVHYFHTGHQNRVLLSSRQELHRMTKFFFGIVTGIVLATVGFNGIAQMGNRAIDSVQSFAQTATN